MNLLIENDQFTFELIHKTENVERLNQANDLMELTAKKLIYILNGKYKLVDNQYDVKNLKNREGCIETLNGYCCFYVNNVLHCEDGPAWFNISKNERKYYINGKLHRENGPAAITAIYRGFCSQYYKNGKLHRTDGPAVEYNDGTNNSYYINGKNIKVKNNDELYCHINKLKSYL